MLPDGSFAFLVTCEIPEWPLTGRIHKMVGQYIEAGEVEKLSSWNEREEKLKINNYHHVSPYETDSTMLLT